MNRIGNSDETEKEKRSDQRTQTENKIINRIKQNTNSYLNFHFFRINFNYTVNETIKETMVNKNQLQHLANPMLDQSHSSDKIDFNFCFFSKSKIKRITKRTKIKKLKTKQNLHMSCHRHHQFTTQIEMKKINFNRQLFH